MISISFDNPYLLIALIPVLALLITPFAIAIRKENRTKAVVASMVLHLVITLFAGFAAAGATLHAVSAQTQVYVLADVSYSADKNLALVDDYIAGLRKELPLNSKMGVVSFGRDCQLTTKMGARFETVSGSSVDDSATDIVGALDYAGTLFNPKAIKRVILITDGKQTDGQTTEALIASVENLAMQGITVDAIYIDSNMPEGRTEAQITGVDYTQSTYLNRDNTAEVLVQSSVDTEAIFTLERRLAGGAFEEVKTIAEPLYKGFNVITFDLDSSEIGVYDYRVTVDVEGDYSQKNNTYDFSQAIEGNLKTLLITSNFEDVVAVANRYLSHASVEAYVRTVEEKPGNLGQPTKVTVTYNVTFEEAEEGAYNVFVRTAAQKDAKAAGDYFKAFASFTGIGEAVSIPYAVEGLCEYDEIILSSVDVRDLDNSVSFTQSLKTVVESFGKSLITAGNLNLQVKEEDGGTDNELEEDSNALETLQKILPVRYGPAEQDAKLYGIVLDVSRSMERLWHFQMAKQAAIQIINLLNDDDFVAVVAFSGDVTFEQLPVRVGPNRTKLVEDINALEVRQGTFLGAALEKTCEFMSSLQFYQEQVVLITDGMSSTAEADDPMQMIKNLRAESVITSVINLGTKDGNVSTDAPGILGTPEKLLKDIATQGGGSYYYVETEEDLSRLMLEDFADEMTDAVINEKSRVTIKRITDDVLDGVVNLPDVYGFLTTEAKASANTVLTVRYQKDSGGYVEVPLYAHWKCGEGKVSSFTSSLSGAWVEGWDNEAGKTFFENVLSENVPAEKNNNPFKLSVSDPSGRTTVSIVPHIIDAAATAKAMMVTPDGRVIEQDLVFDKTGYVTTFETELQGRYELKVVYTRGASVYETTTIFNISYFAEYDEFATYDPSTVYQFIRHRGTVSEDGELDMSIDEEKVDMATIRLAPYLLLLSVVLFVADVMVRKLTKADWINLAKWFKKLVKGGKK